MAKTKGATGARRSLKKEADEIKTVPRDPRWQPKMRFRASHASLHFSIPNTEVVVYGPAGRGPRLQGRRVIEFRNGIYEADGNKYILQADPISGEVQRIDEVTLMFNRPEYCEEPTGPGGVHGMRFWVERGDEDLKAAVERMKRQLAADPDAYSAEDILRLGAAAAAAEARAVQAGRVQVVEGVRDAEVAALAPTPEPSEDYESIAKATEGLSPADERAAEALRSLGQQGAKLVNSELTA